MTGPNMQELEKIEHASYISGIMPQVRLELNAMIRVAQTRVFTAMREGTYTAEFGDNTWREIYAYDRLLKRLDTTVRVGQHVGGKVASNMTIGDPNV